MKIFFIKICLSILRIVTHPSVVFAAKIASAVSLFFTAIFYIIPIGWIKYLISIPLGRLFINHSFLATIAILMFPPFCLIMTTTILNKPTLADFVSPLAYSLAFNTAMLFYSWYTNIQVSVTDSPGPLGYFVMFFITSFIFFAFKVQKNGNVEMRIIN